MLLRIAGGLLIAASLLLVWASLKLAVPQPFIDAEDVAANTRMFQLFAGGAAVTFLGGLMVLLKRP